MKVDDEKLLEVLNNYVKSMTKKQLEAYVAEERLDYFYGGFVEQEELDEFNELLDKPESGTIVHITGEKMILSNQKFLEIRGKEGLLNALMKSSQSFQDLIFSVKQKVKADFG